MISFLQRVFQFHRRSLGYTWLTSRRVCLLLTRTQR